MKKAVLYYTDSFDGKSSHALLSHAASHYARIPENSLSLHSERGKKPYFESHPHVHFSISHSGNIWVCAFAEDEIGVDVQLLANDRPHVKLAERFFHPDEAQDVKNAKNTVAAFTRIWSRKEAVVKLFGIGIDSRFSVFDSRGDRGNFMESDVHLRDIRLPVTESHSAAAAFCGEFEIEIIKLT